MYDGHITQCPSDTSIDTVDRCEIHPASQPAGWDACLCWLCAGAEGTMMDQTEILLSKKLVQCMTLEQGFSISTLDILSWIILRCKGCWVDLKMLSSVPGLYPRGSSSTCPSHHDYQTCLQTLATVPWLGRAEWPPVEKHCFKARSSTLFPTYPLLVVYLTDCYLIFLIPRT